MPTPFTRNTLSWSNSIGIPAGGHEHGYAVANDDGVGMIAFKLSAVEQLHGEDVQRLTAAEFMEYSIEVIRGHGFVIF